MNTVPTDAELVGWIIIAIIGLVAFGILWATGRVISHEYVPDDWTPPED